MTSSQEDQATTSASDGQVDQKPDVEQIQADIEKTRQELGETVDALTAKLDVRSRAKERLQVTRERAAGRLSDTQTRVQTRATELTRSARSAATTDQGKPAPAALIGAAAVVVSAVVATSLVLWRRRR
jgi:ElaB/YqjD/DUF883 family membrane-anchored ribosome-binding protein